MLGLLAGGVAVYFLVGSREGGPPTSDNAQASAHPQRFAVHGSAGARGARRGDSGGGTGGRSSSPRRSPATAAGGGPGVEPGSAARPSAGAPPPLTPLTPPTPLNAADTVNAGPEGVRVALVIDDLGRSLADLDTLKRLGVPLTYAVLPYESQTAEVADVLHRRGDEVLCHLPMEPRAGGNPGPGALRLGMSPGELRQSTVAALRAVPGAVGVNNHMGSSLSADATSMSAILGVLAARGLFFLDSRTSAQSVGYRLATALGIPAAERQVFLDDDQSPEAIHAQFARLLEMARSRGEAIAIGHPHSATLDALASEVPRAKALGYRFVPVSALLARPDAGREARR